MKRHHLWIGCTLPLALLACNSNPSHRMQLKYPETHKDTTVADNYFGTIVKDPYRWLEDDTSAATAAWVDAQNKVTQDYLSAIPFREALKNRLQTLANGTRYAAPVKAGKWIIYQKNTGLQNQNVLMIREGLAGAERVLIDPNVLSKEGFITAEVAGVSHDHRYVAISQNTAGSDWQEMYVMELATGKRLPDELKWLKFSGAAWQGNGFYYSRYPEPVSGTALSGKNEKHRIYYHQLGTPQSADQLVYEDTEHPLRYHGASVTDDEKWLVLGASEGTDGSEIKVKSLKKQGAFQLLFKGFTHNYNLVGSLGNELLFLTNENAPFYKLIAVNPEAPSQVRDLIPEQQQLLENVTYAGGKLMAIYLENATSRVKVFSTAGKQVGEINTPVPGTVSGFSGEPDDDLLLYNFYSWAVPNTIYSYVPASGKTEVFLKNQVPFDPAQIQTSQVFYTSADGTRVPMFLIHKKGIRLNKANPTLLYGYGGFNINLTPGFNAMRIAFIEAGGVYAIANLRGGGEYGEAWHRAGMLEKKQNVFDDFISAAQFLIDTGYTSSARLGIMGGSNGGLLVGACMTQRPDLFKVAIPQVGVLDMLRYHKFTIGWGWAVEYGSSDDSTAFQYLKAYSPLHNLKKGVAYPATLVMTADHDDRVVPAHSFKFIAALQEAHKGNNPVLIRIEQNAGHGAGKSVNKYIDEMADVYAFLFHNMNFEPQLP